MTNPGIVIRPFLARQAVDAATYVGHDGVRDWIGGLEDLLTITLDLIQVDVPSEQAAIVETEVSFEQEGDRISRRTFSIWRFAGDKLSEAIGYDTREDAQDAEREGWH
jgi:hypothetical protein